MPDPDKDVRAADLLSGAFRLMTLRAPVRPLPNGGAVANTLLLVSGVSTCARTFLDYHSVTLAVLLALANVVFIFLWLRPARRRAAIAPLSLTIMITDLIAIPLLVADQGAAAGALTAWSMVVMVKVLRMYLKQEPVRGGSAARVGCRP